jgi:hypothetical protein
VLAGVLLEIAQKVNENYSAYLDSHPTTKFIVEWSLWLLPWVVLSIITFLFLRWRKKAKSLERAHTELSKSLEEANQELSEYRSKCEGMNKWDGIEPTTGLERYIKKLDGSGHHPRELLEKIDKQLDFMGHGASKWTANREKLERMLKKIKYNKGNARFLVINPLQTGLELERAKRIARSLRTLGELKKKHDNLEVRVYGHIPQLRLTFYPDRDDDVVVVGHYQGMDREDSSNTPLLVFRRRCEWSFYKAFLSHFDSEWERGKGLAELDASAIDRLASS